MADTAITVFADDIANLISADDLSTTMVIGSDTVSCLDGENVRTDDLQMAGILQEYEYPVICAASEFNTLPTVGKLATIGAVQYRIRRVSTSLDGTLIMLDLEQKASAI